MRRGALPWRLGGADCEAALEGLRADSALELTGRALPTAWDPELSFSMRAAGVAVHEESLLDALLADLTRASPA
jgi:hypothetical protein